MKHAVLIWVICISLGFVSSARSDDRVGKSIAQPGRPRPVSLAQFQALHALASQPDHAWVADATAAYSPERARAMTDAGVAAFQIALPTSILIALIAAAPL